MFKMASIFPLSLLLTLLTQTCYCYGYGYGNIQNCIRNPSSSCGHIHNISYPFRLTTDPIGCGDELLEISCDNNVPILLYNKSDKYYVRSINYDNYTIRLFDASLAPLINNPTFFCNRSPIANPIPYDDPMFYNYNPYQPDGFLYQELVIISCPSQLLNPRKHSYMFYVDGGATCSPHDQYTYWYSITGDFVEIEDLEDSCRVELMGVTSLPLHTSMGSTSFHDVRESLEYGFELSWLLWYCDSDNYDGAPCSMLITKTGILRQLLTILHERTSLAIATIVNKFGFKWKPEINDFTNTVPGYMIKIATILAYVFGAFAMHRVTLCMVCTPLSMILLLYKWRRRHLSFDNNIEDFLQNTSDQLMPVRYSYRAIKKITQGFKHKLGEGGYGSVYKGKLRSGQLAAVKMLGKVENDGNDFINEIATIGRVHHFNVVRLIGFCAEGSKRALVYPFMPNGSLDKYILSQEKGYTNGMLTISNEKIYEIALGVAHGIEYLHRGCNMQILHFDIKPHNILLDDNFVPKVADFGLAKLYPANTSIVSLTAIKGTLGYMAPEFFYRSVGDISYKADVYSFGKMLMEMATRKRDPNSLAENSSQLFLPSWVHDQFTQGNETGLADTTEEDKEVTKKMMIVGLWCVQLRPKDRPSMNNVIEMLQRGIDTLQLPSKPSFAPSFISINMEGSPTATTSPS